MTFLKEAVIFPVGNDAYSYLKSVCKSLLLSYPRPLVLKTSDRWEYTDITLQSSPCSFHKIQICSLSEQIQQEKDIQGLSF